MFPSLVTWLSMIWNHCVFCYLTTQCTLVCVELWLLHWHEHSSSLLIWHMNSVTMLPSEISKCGKNCEAQTQNRCSRTGKHERDRISGSTSGVAMQLVRIPVSKTIKFTESFVWVTLKVLCSPVNLLCKKIHLFFYGFHLLRKVFPFYHFFGKI